MKKTCEAALAIDPKHVDALELASDFYRFAPGIMGGDKKKSVEYVDRMVQVDPVAGWMKRAEVAADDKDTVRTGECYRKAVEADPASARAAVSYGWWLVPKWRDPAQAEKLALGAVQAEPWRTGGWQVLAALYAYQERWTELDDVLKKSEAAEPTHLVPWYTAARQLINTGKEPARAEAYLRHYLSREPEIGSPSVAAARWRLGQALEKQGKKSEAVAELETAVKLDPKLDDAKKDLKRLRG
jgi:Tfp pilus assembly protein PilF